MHKIFVEAEYIGKEEIRITGENLNHIKNVLRCEKGEKIEITSILEDHIVYISRIQEINKEEIVCKIMEKQESSIEPSLYITIIQGIPKLDKMEWIIEKCTELGAKEFVPFKLNRCVVKIEEKEEEKKITRWQKIAAAAAAQSKRNCIPKINKIYNMKNIFSFLQTYDIVLVAYEKEQSSLKKELRKINIKPNMRIAIIIGPEGGLEEQEVETFKQNGAKIVSLGKRILRTETAPISCLTNVLYELEE